MPVRAPGDPGPQETPLPVGWQTGFEDGFCGYQHAQGFCYSDPDATYHLVESPTRTGRFAAAFTISSDPLLDARQARCVREGILPAAAYYGAWFYVPSGTTTGGNWNLMHFQGTEGDAMLRNLWDVSIVSDDTGAMHVRLNGYLGSPNELPEPDVELPADTWFFIKVYLRRSAESNGEISLYVDGTPLIQRTGIPTDNSAWGQWYVGNLSNDLNPPTSTLYVDDVSIEGASDSAL